MNKQNHVIIGVAIGMCVSLLLSILSILMILSMAKSTHRAQVKADAVMADVWARMDSIDRSTASITDRITCTDCEEREETTDDATTDADVLYDVFSIREVNGQIGIFTDEGYLIRTLPVDIRTLPTVDREALASGITVNSWRELIAMIEDFEG